MHMVDGSTYVIALDLDDLVTAVREHRAALVLDRRRLADVSGTMAAAVPPGIPRARRPRAEGSVGVVPALDAD